MFLALPGAHVDGHDYAASAAAAGAVAVLAARPVGVPAIVVTPERSLAEGALAGVLEHDADGSGAAVLAALAKLAKAVAAELVAGGLTIIGITGSSGKTSTRIWWLRCCSLWVWWLPRPDPSTTSWVIPGPCCVPAATPTT
ncbi:hypothetical protein NIIDMKKI_28250 [Mycobacterium kansasii]|uniref:Mur ligase N-terminal catalytic domain-containing protein n=1 Tax=Mycobacterium kansasii TaxID=1768 RepID=A0A7G1IDJ0_MYCKA|nr:hypothetical protein NIIDMKKI_28250 [Mycobacterium kansasii]